MSALHWILRAWLIAGGVSAVLWIATMLTFLRPTALWRGVAIVLVAVLAGPLLGWVVVATVTRRFTGWQIPGALA